MQRVLSSVVNASRGFKLTRSLSLSSPMNYEFIIAEKKGESGTNTCKGAYVNDNNYS